MRESKIIKEELLGYETKFVFYRDGRMSVERTFPNEDDLRSLLIIIRPFTLNNDPIYYLKIISIIRKRLSGKSCSICLNEYVSIFKTSIEKSERKLRVEIVNGGKDHLQIEANDYSMKEIYDLYLNGHYFHHDIPKIEKLESFKSDYFQDAGEVYAKSMLLGMIIEYFSFFNNLDYYIISDIISEVDNAHN
jgi:hypothetical protein